MSIRVKLKSQDSLKIKSSVSNVTTNSISDISDVDTSNLQDGSVLIFKESTGKWESGILLEKQTVECGQY